MGDIEIVDDVRRVALCAPEGNVEIRLLRIRSVFSTLRRGANRKGNCGGKRSQDRRANKLYRPQWPPQYARHCHSPRSGLLVRYTQTHKSLTFFRPAKSQILLSQFRVTILGL